MESPSNGDLPADVIHEILLRLPVKTLLQFKCVCKQWYSLIGSSGFVSQHFAHETNQERLLVRFYKPYDYCYTFALYVDDVCSEYEEPDHLQVPDTIEVLMGPVNGVFCVVGLLGDMALLNPAMREFKILPVPHPDVQPQLFSFDNVLGFGLDPLNGDYKLVWIQYFWNEEMDVRHGSPLVSVYSLSSDSWRHLEDVGLINSSHCAYRSLSNTYVDGVYYWLMEFDNTNVAALLAFDMTNEKFQDIQVPDCVKSGKRDLALYGDSIALLSYDLEQIDKCIDIWVMKKEGCWTKSSTVGPFQDIRWPLCFWKNNELLLGIGVSILSLSNVFTQKLRTVNTGRNENEIFVHWVFSYKESLVSIKGGRGNCMLWDPSSDYVKYFIEYSSTEMSESFIH